MHERRPHSMWGQLFVLPYFGELTCSLDTFFKDNLTFLNLSKSVWVFACRYLEIESSAHASRGFHTSLHHLFVLTYDPFYCNKSKHFISAVFVRTHTTVTVVAPVSHPAQLSKCFPIADSGFGHDETSLKYHLYCRIQVRKYTTRRFAVSWQVFHGDYIIFSAL